MKVLLSGPSGRVGPHLVAPFRDKYELRTFDLEASGEPNSFVGDLSEIEPLRQAMRGVDVVVHLAATSDEAPFVEKLVPNNVIGAYNVFEACRLEQVRRLVFASTIQGMGFNLKLETLPIETDVPARPMTLYGATKIWAETMGHYFHDKFGLEFIAIRIGAFQPYDSVCFSEGWGGDIWLSPRDCASIFQRAIEVPNLGYAVVNGTSKTFVEKMSLRSAREVLGYEPQDDARDFYQPKSKTGMFQL